MKNEVINKENELKNEEGATMVEYALLVALIAIALIAVIQLLTAEISDTFSTAASAMDEVN